MSAANPGAPAPEKIIDSLMFKAFDDDDGDESSDTNFQDPIKYHIDVHNFFTLIFHIFLHILFFIV